MVGSGTSGSQQTSPLLHPPPPFFTDLPKSLHVDPVKHSPPADPQVPVNGTQAQLSSVVLSHFALSMHKLPTDLSLQADAESGPAQLVPPDALCRMSPLNLPIFKATSGTPTNKTKAITPPIIVFLLNFFLGGFSSGNSVVVESEFGKGGKDEGGGGGGDEGIAGEGGKVGVDGNGGGGEKVSSSAVGKGGKSLKPPPAGTSGTLVLEFISFGSIFF